MRVNRRRTGGKNVDAKKLVDAGRVVEASKVALVGLKLDSANRIGVDSAGVQNCGPGTGIAQQLVGVCLSHVLFEIPILVKSKRARGKVARLPVVVQRKIQRPRVWRCLASHLSVAIKVPKVVCFLGLTLVRDVAALKNTLKVAVRGIK